MGIFVALVSEVNGFSSFDSDQWFPFAVKNVNKSKTETERERERESAATVEKWIHTQANTKTDKQIRIWTNKTKIEIEKIYTNNFIKQANKKNIFENYCCKVIKRETYQTKMYLRPKPDRNKLRNIEIYDTK